ncbi:MAG: choice-of-anchor X domain-containing protein [Planctomycetota bacterium]
MPRTILPAQLALGALLVAPALAAQSLGGAPLVARQVAAPADDILDGTLRLPPPSAGAVRSRGAFFELEWQVDGRGGWRADVELPVARGPLGLAVQAFGASEFDVQLDVAGVAEFAAERRDQTLPVHLGGTDVQRWDVALDRSGVARVTVRSSGESHPGRAVLVARDDQPLTAAAYVDAKQRLSNRELALVAQVERDGDGHAEDRLLFTVTSGWVELEGPGVSTRLRLSDDGLSGDGAAGDGRFGVVLPAGLSGSYAARVELGGSWGGAEFVRTTRVTFDVAEPLLALTGRVETEVLDARRMRLDVDAIPLADARRVQVSAEVWAHDEWGHLQPMTWLSRIEEPRESVSHSGHWSLPLWLDAGWFSNAGLRPPLELRNVRVQDPDHHGVLAIERAMPVPPGPLPPLAGRGDVPMGQLVGVNANASVPLAPLPEFGAVRLRPGLVLTHGYCAGGNPWPNADFSQPKFAFSDPGQNRSHDEFANLIVSQASGFTSYGIVGHSQGGPAALQLLTFYQSPLDNAQGPRRIQSVGSPYQGTPLASLGFFSCGVNTDLTPGGAATWLAGIPTWARAEVYYYTTANDGSACQFLTDLLLSNPEDGTTERSRGQLPGGNNMGHVTGWCHTTGMSDPPQYDDGSRNAVMDAAAAR